MNKLGSARAAFVVAALTACVAACSSTTSPTPSGTSGGTSGTTGDAATPAGNTVTVGGTSNAFAPAMLTIKVGETVTWNWAGGSHTVTSGTGCMSDAKFGTDGVLTGAGATFSHTFPTAGTFEYFCQPHCSFGMKGTIVVQ
jgi:plastocyanin